MGLPYTKGSETSKDAAESMVEESKNQRQVIWEYIRDQGDTGLTYYEAKQIFQIDGPRMTELRRLGRIKETDRTRLTATGRHAKVYVAVDPADWKDKRKGWPTPRREMSEDDKELALWKKRAHAERAAKRKLRKRLDRYEPR